MTGTKTLKTFLSGIAVLLLTLSANLTVFSGVRASEYDPDTGIIYITCLEGVILGQRTGKIRYVELLYEADMLRVLDLSKTAVTGPCEATLDLIELTYRDVITIDGESVELNATLLSGARLGVTNLYIRNNLITEDVTLAENETREISLPVAIDLQNLELLLDGGDNTPAFVSLLGDSLFIEPVTGDAGVYSLRLQWNDQVEFLEVTVTEALEESIDFSTQPATLPEFGSINLYASTSPFNTPIGVDPAIDPDSDSLVASIKASMQAVVQVNQYSTPVYFANSMTPRTNVALACGEVWELGISEMTGIPIPDWAEASFDTDGDPPVMGCGEDSGQDNFMVILDLENRCEYDFWQARQEGDSWVASFGVGVSMDGSGVNANGLSARGSGLAFLGGVIWPDEIANGRIYHPLAFSYEFTKAGGPVAPATDSDGISTEDFAIPEGARIQLDPDFDLDSLDLAPYERTIAVALQEYGMILVDSGSEGPVGFYAIDPDSVTGDMWGQLWGNEDYISLENLDLATLPFRVLELGPQKADYQEQLALNMGSCSAYQ